MKKAIIAIALAAVCAATLCFGACAAASSDDDGGTIPATDLNNGTVTGNDLDGGSDNDLDTGTGSGTGTGTDTDDSSTQTANAGENTDADDGEDENASDGTSSDGTSTDENTTIVNNGVMNTYYTMTDEQFREYMEYLEANDVSTESKLEAASARSVFSSVSVLSILTYMTQSSSSSRPGAQRTYIYSDAAYNGSGVILDLDKENGDAYVLTNCHVIYDDTAVNPIADRVYLYLYGQDIAYQNYTLESSTTTYSGSSGSTYYKYDCTGDDQYRITATVVAASVQYDLALLKVSGSSVLQNSNAIAATFSQDDEVYIGESVYAVGNPLGDGTTVTTGVVSQDTYETSLAIDSSIYNLYREIKTDTAVNGGNSGGGLYNSNGELIGIVSAKLESTEVENNAYALCGSYVRRIYQLMRDTSTDSAVTDTGITRAYLKGAYSSTTTTSSGTKVQTEIDTGYAASYTYAYLDESGTTPRARIAETVSVTTTSYGLAVGDIITHLTITDGSGNAVEDLDITRKYMLDDALISYRDGYTVTLTYTHDGEELTKAVDCQWYDLT